MKNSNIIFSFVISLLLFACVGNSEKSELEAKPKPKTIKSIKYSSADVLNELADAEIFLDLKQKNNALNSIENAQKMLPDFALNTNNQSDLLVELTYVNNGLKTKLYIPSKRGEARFDQTKKILKTLQKSKIEAKEYRLVNYNKNINKNQARKNLNLVVNALESKDIANSNNSINIADRNLDKFFLQLKISPYNGNAKNRAIFHSQAAEIFIAQNEVAIAKDALSLAKKAVADLNKSEDNMLLVKQYNKRFDDIEAKIDAKDPSFIDVIKGSIVN